VPDQKPSIDLAKPKAQILVEEKTEAHQRVNFVRPLVRGKFLFAGGQKLFVKGVTYGAFRPDEHGREYTNTEVVERDFAQMAANGVNTVRIPHTTPPRSLLDIAQRHGLYVMVGLSAEQYVGYLVDEKPDAPDIEKLVRDKVRGLAGHPALLSYAIGNEIPASLVRYWGRREVERYLQRIYDAIKAEDPAGIVTYVNYPTTEYLDLAFLDLVCFNVYLESKDRLQAYLGRLQNIAGSRPLILSEVGLDSLRNGEITQAEVLDWQVRTAFGEGCAGVFIFAWTDEWYRGETVSDWEFGLTRINRTPKPALTTVREAFVDLPFSKAIAWPKISVVVCSCNGNRTIGECLAALSELTYPDYEVIVIDDGSTDGVSETASRYDVHLIRTGNRGLSAARNLGYETASGEIVAYIDDDAYPDPDWLTYLASTFLTTDFVGVGGPNFPPSGDGLAAECIARTPGGPVHVLLSDREAEHIPGCNMAFRRSAIEAVGGFDPRFRSAGDDVDFCWRLQERGWKIGFSPAAQVWHHSRDSVRRFYRQQRGYGHAEALLEKKWPQKYNSAGHLTWAGRVYTESVVRILGGRCHVYHGQWGTAPFQSRHARSASPFQGLYLMPEWYLVNIILAILVVAGLSWKPLLLALPLLLFCAGAPLKNVLLSAARTRFQSNESILTHRILTAFLYMMQPFARLHGRLICGLTLWRRRVKSEFTRPTTRKLAFWANVLGTPEQRLEAIEERMLANGSPVRRGGDFDLWDLEVLGGLLGSARLIMSCEHPVGGFQMVRFRIWSSFSAVAGALSGLAIAASIAAAAGGAWGVPLMLGAAAGLLVWNTVAQCGAAVAELVASTKQNVGEEHAIAMGKAMPAVAEPGAAATALAPQRQS
jgi:O-antigen biosynthesis protein